MVVTLVSILTILAFVLHKHAKRIKPFIIALAGTTASVYLLKLIFGLKRPEYAVYVESSPSFPSGHAATAMVLYGFLLLTAWKHDKHHLKNPLIFGLAILILLVGISRLYLGVFLPFFPQIRGSFRSDGGLRGDRALPLFPPRAESHCKYVLYRMELFVHRASGRRGEEQ
jgi:hypothetical protein